MASTSKRVRIDDNIVEYICDDEQTVEVFLSKGEDLCANDQRDLPSNAPYFDITTDDISHTDDDYLCNLSESVLVKLNASADDMWCRMTVNRKWTAKDKKSRYTSPSGREWFEIIVQGNSGRAAARNIFLPQPDNFLHLIKNFQSVFAALIMIFCISGVNLGTRPANEREAFLLIFADIINEAVIYTNLEAYRVISICQVDAALRQRWRPIDRAEIEAFIGFTLLQVL